MQDVVGPAELCPKKELEASMTAGREMCKDLSRHVVFPGFEIVERKEEDGCPEWS